jgi:hypothetical protein
LPRLQITNRHFAACSSSPMMARTGTFRLDAYFNDRSSLRLPSGKTSTFRRSARSSLASASASARSSSPRKVTITSTGPRDTVAGNIPRSVMTTMMRSSPSEKPQAGTSRPRNMPTRLS